MRPEATDKGLDQRIELLEDIERIKRLKALYCYLADEAYQNPAKWDDLLTHFIDESWLDFGDHGVYKGKQEVSRFFTEVTHSFLSYAAHMVTNPLIDVDANDAIGRWYFHCPATERSSATALWVQGRYIDEFVRCAEGWKWKSITCHFNFITPYDDGWAKTPFLS